MDVRFVPMTREAADKIACWHYPGIYRFYDLDEDPEDREEFLDSRSWEDTTFAAVNEVGDLIGFFSFEPEDGALILGLGLHPDMTGQGWGEGFVRAGLDFAAKRYQLESFRVSVSTFNARAIRVYERLGFVAEEISLQKTNGGEYDFLRMSRPHRP